MNPQEIATLIETAIPDARVTVQTADGVHFEALVVSESFQDQPRLARHRLVYDALGEKMGNDIHALSLRTLTPAEA